MELGAKSRLDVAVVIPTYNGRELLERCLEALKNQTRQNFNIYVIDNSSTDGTRDWLEQEYPSVRVVKMRENVGFCAAVNAGIETSTEPLILLLNNDAFPNPDMLAQLTDRAHEKPSESIWAAVLFYEHDPQTIESAGISVRKDGTPCVLWRDQPSNSLPTRPIEVFGACGAAALFRRDVFNLIGRFDERFLFYGDDTDVAIRARLAGFGCTLIPTAKGLHRHRATSSKRPNTTAYLQHRNTVLYLIKTMPLPFLFRRLPRFLFTGILPILTKPWSGQGWSILGAKFGIIWNLPYAILSRFRIHKFTKPQSKPITDFLDNGSERGLYENKDNNY